MKKQEISSFMAGVFTLAWLVIELFVISRHEIWLDEAQHWLLAKNSNSIGELLANMRYEGHSPLWNILLFFGSRISGSIWTLKVIHLLFAGGTVFLILRYAPFPLWVKLILPFTYFLGYEYAIVSRNYAPAVFFVVLACVCASTGKRKLILVSLFLGIASCFHVYAAGIGIVLLLYLFRKHKTTAGEILKVVSLFSCLIIAAVFFLFAVPSDHFLFGYGNIFTLQKAGAVVLLPFTSLMHFPDIVGNNWWNSNLFLGKSDVVKAALGIAFWIISLLVFRKRNAVLWLYLVGILLLSIVMWLTPMHLSVRHAGFVALLFFVSLWISGKEMYTSKFPKTVCIAILLVQFISYGYTAYKEIRCEFSQSENTAKFIAEKYPDSKVAVFPVYLGPSVSVYLERPVFYAYRKPSGTFADWNFGSVFPDPGTIVADCRYYMDQEAIDTMILVAPLKEDIFHVPLPDSTMEAKFSGAAVMAENFNVYLITRK